MSIRRQLISFLFFTLIFFQASICFALSGYSVQIDEHDLQKNSYNFTYAENSQLSDQFTVINLSESDPLSVDFTGVDAVNNDLGFLGFKNNSAEQLFLGKWIHFNPQSITLKPGEKKQIDFTVTPPPDALPGVYIGGISIQGADMEPIDSTSQPTQAFSATVKTRFVKKVYLQMPGTVVSQGDVKDFQFSTNNNGLYFSFDIVNSGNSLLQAKGTITVTGGPSNINLSIPVKINSIQGGTSSPTRIAWPNSKNVWGNYQAVLDLDLQQYDPFKEELLDLKSVNLSTSIQIIPWNYIGMIAGSILLIILIVTFIVVRKKLYLKNCEPYTVRAGDTIKTVATRHQMSWQKLAKINKLSAPFELTPNTSILVRKTFIKTNENQS